MYVYVIAESLDGPCKIGIGLKPEARVASLQVGNPRKLFVAARRRLESALDVERIAHAKAEPRRLCGEWFDISVAEAVEVIEHAVGDVADIPDFEPISPIVRALHQAKVPARWRNGSHADPDTDIP